MVDEGIDLSCSLWTSPGSARPPQVAHRRLPLLYDLLWVAYGEQICARKVFHDRSCAYCWASRLGLGTPCTAVRGIVLTSVVPLGGFVVQGCRLYSGLLSPPDVLYWGENTPY